MVSASDRKQQKRDEAVQRQRIAALRKPLQARVDKVEAELARVQQELRTLDDLIANPDLYTDTRRDERVAALARHGLRPDNKLMVRVFNAADDFAALETLVADILTDRGPSPEPLATPARASAGATLACPI